MREARLGFAHGGAVGLQVRMRGQYVADQIGQRRQVVHGDGLRARAGIHIECGRQLRTHGAAQVGQRLLHAQRGGLFGPLGIEQFGIAADQLIARGLARLYAHGNAAADLLDQRHVFAGVALLGLAAQHIVEAQLQLCVQIASG